MSFDSSHGLVFLVALFGGVLFAMPSQAEAPVAVECAGFSLPMNYQKKGTGEWVNTTGKQEMGVVALPAGFTAVGGSGDSADGKVIACR